MKRRQTFWKVAQLSTAENALFIVVISLHAGGAESPERDTTESNLGILVEVIDDGVLSKVHGHGGVAERSELVREGLAVILWDEASGKKRRQKPC